MNSCAIPSAQQVIAVRHGGNGIGAQGLRQRRSTLPAIGSRVIDLVHIAGQVVGRHPAGDIEPAIHHRRIDLDAAVDRPR
ncbi:MAG TPA: hypothetical protein PKY10_03255, partial [Lentisphaeria bacterium]|nr:hypothetical protein [Lentisphaeria bacterium]